MARRVNTKFLIILTLVIGGGAVMALLASRVLTRKDPDALVRESEQLLAAGDFEQAVRKFQQAVGARPNDPALRVRLGDLWLQRIQIDGDALRRALGHWNSALEVDPDHLPAIERLVQFYRNLVQVSPRSENFAELRRIAQKQARLQPENYDVQGLVHQAVIEPWVSQGYPTSDDVIDEALAGLQRLMEKDPAGALYPYWIARAKLFRARTEPQVVRQKMRDEAIKVMEDAVARQPDNPAMHWRASDIYLQAAATETEKDARAARIEQVKASAYKARELVKPDDRNYVQIQLNAAEVAARSNELDKANEIMQALAEARPDDQFVRLQQARLLGRDPKRCDEAIALLERPVAPSEVSLDTALRGDLALATKGQLLELKIQKLDTIADAEQKKQAIREAETLLADLGRRASQTPALLRLRGQLQLAQGRTVEAVRTFEEARDLAAHERQPTDYPLLLLLAQSYMRLGQSGLAEPLLNEVLRAIPDHTPSRLVLAELLLQRNDVTGAQEQLRMLKEQGADAATLQGLEIAIASARADKTTIAKEYSALSEETTVQMARKAQIAIATNNRADAIRLLEKARAADPKAINPVALAALYLGERQRDKAAEVVNGALAADPDNRSLRLLAEQLKAENVTPEQYLEMRRRIAADIPDEYERAVNLFDIERDAGNLDAALEQLQRAQALRPDDLDLKVQVFLFHLQRRDWPAAEALAAELGRHNKDQVNGLTYRYQLAMVREQYEEAVQIASQLVDALPQLAQHHLALAQARQRLGQVRPAIDAYQKVLERQRTNMDAYRGLIACYYALHQYDDALRYIEEGRRIRPNDPYFAEARLEHAERYGNPADALPAREEAVKNNPNDAAAVARLGRAYQASARYSAQRNNQAAAKAATEKARATYARAVQTWPDEPAFYRSLAETQAALGDLEGGEKTLRALFEREPWKDRPEPHQLLAEYLARIGRVPDAKAEMRQAMLKAKGDVNVRLALANFLAQAGDVAAALEELAAAGDDPRVQTQRIEILLQAGLFADAQKALEEAIAQRPESAALKAQLAALHYETARAEPGRKDKAFELAGEALARDPNNAQAMLVRGRVQLDRGQLEQAAQTLEAARAQQPQNVATRLALSEAYRRLNNWNAAVIELQEAVEVQPQNKGLRLELLRVLSSARPPRWIEAEALLRQTRQMPQFAEDLDVILAESNMRRARGQLPQALAAVQEGLKLAPENPVLLNQSFELMLAMREYKRVLDESEALTKKEQVPAWVHQVRAIALKGTGDRAAALAEYHKALAAPEARQVPDITARIIASMAREIGVDEAVTEMGQKVETDPAWQLLAIQLYHAGDRHDRAIELLERMDESKLNDAQRKQYLRMAGMVYSTARPTPRPEKSLEAYVKLLEIEPDALDVLNNLACLLIDTMRPADPNRAYTYSQRAIDVMNQKGQMIPLIQDTHGWVMVHIPERQVQGTNLLAEVVSREPDFPEAYYHLGVAYLKQQQPQRAIPQLQRARQMILDMEPKGQAQYAELKTQVDDALAQAQYEASTSDKAAAIR